MAHRERFDSILKQLLDNQVYIPPGQHDTDGFYMTHDVIRQRASLDDAHHCNKDRNTKNA